MAEAVNRSSITDPEDLNYISGVVSQVLEDKHELGSIKDVQSALSAVSLEQGREVQINLVFEESQLAGFNFSFKSEPSKTTPTIPFKQQQLNVDAQSGNIIPHKQQTTIDVATSKGSQHLTIPANSSSEIILAPGLQVEGQRIITPDAEALEVLKSPSSNFNQINPALKVVAHQLASRHEIDGLLLTGLALKAGVALASTLQTEDKPDIHTAGLAVIKRFQQVLPNEFVLLKSGATPKPLTWKDPKSDKQYRFEFEQATTSPLGDVVTPIRLKGFEKNDLTQPVFAATLIDAKYDRWHIEQCDFTANQIFSLNKVSLPTRKELSPVTAITGEGFSYSM